MGIELKADWSGIAPIVVIGGYAVVLHFLHWAKDQYLWARRTVNWVRRVTKHGESVFLIWALIADLLVVVFIVIWLTGIR